MKVINRSERDFILDVTDTTEVVYLKKNEMAEVTEEVAKNLSELYPDELVFVEEPKEEEPKEEKEAKKAKKK